MPPITLKCYLGDSVYASFIRGGILLTTENGLPSDPSNEIFLEPEVLQALNDFVQSLRNAAREHGGS